MQSAEGAENETPKVSRGAEWGLEGLGERRKLPQRGPGGAAAKNDFTAF